MQHYPVNHIVIGDNIRRRRNELGLSPLIMARELGISTEMLFEYEKGLSPVSPELLEQFAGKMSVRAEYFLEPIDDVTFESAGRQLQQAFDTIPEPRVRKAMVHFMRSISTLTGRD